MKTAVIVGHTEQSKGSCSPYGIPCEWEFNLGIANKLRDLGCCDVLEYSDYRGGYFNMVKALSGVINSGGYDFVIELHYNFFSVGSVSGCEALYYYRNESGRKLCDFFCKEYANIIGGKNRGSKGLKDKTDRGFYALYLPKPTTILLEPFFGSNKEDVDRIKGNEDKYVDILSNLINQYEFIISD